MGAREISQFLTWLAVQRRVSASTQNQALSAVLFLYKLQDGYGIRTVQELLGASGRPDNDDLPALMGRDWG